MLIADKVKSLFTARSNNSKTGDMPQQSIGETREESKASCVGCPLLEKVCYAHNGTPSWGHKAAIRSYNNGKDKSIDYALAHRAKTAKFLRLGAIGEPTNAIDTQEAMDKAKNLGLGVIGYTHNWQEAENYKGLLMASADTLEEAKEAIDKGWRAYLHMPKAEIDGKTKGRFDNGKTFTTCPHKSHEVKCNDCGLCDASRKAVDLIIVDDL